MMSIFSAQPEALLVIAGLTLLVFLWFLQFLLKHETGHTWSVWLAMAIVAFYLLWQRGAWLVARFMDTVESIV